MRIFIVLFSIFLNTLLSAQIKADISFGCAPLTVKFTPPAGMTTYYWDFDDGASSELASPSNVFLTPKTPYKVSLRASKTGPILHTIDINVYPKPVISTPILKGCAPLDANIIPNYTLPSGVTATSIKYIFGDGGTLTKTSPTLSPASHTYSKGSYNVTFEITTSPTNAGCNNTVTVNAAVNASSIVGSFFNSPSAGCDTPFTTTFSTSITADRPIVEYNWNFDGIDSSKLASPSYTINKIGTTVVTLKVKDDYGCEKIFTRNITVQKNNTSAIISKDTVCVNSFLQVSHDGNSGLNTLWGFPGASSFTSTTARNSQVSYSSIGTYDINLTTSYAGVCPITIKKKITVIDPQMTFTIIPRPLCNKKNSFILIVNDPHLFDSATWFIRSKDPNYITPNKVISTKLRDTITYDIDDLDTLAWKYKDLIVSVSAISKFGCIIDSSDTLTISPIIAHIAPNKTYGCAPLTVGFVDRTDDYRKDTVVEWKIDFGDGTVATYTSFSDTIYHTFTKRDTYDVRMIVKNKHGCLDTTYVTKITVGTPHTADFNISPNGGLCASDASASITLTSNVSKDSVQVTKFWADGFQCIGQDNLTYRPKKTAGVQQIKMEVSDNGCFSQVTKTIYIKGPIAKFQYLQFCDTTNKVVFMNTSQEATRYSWNFGTAGTSTDPNPTVYFPADGNYNVTLTAYNDTNGCPASTYTLQIKIQTPKAKFTKDTFVFCVSDLSKVINANLSSGYINDAKNTGFIWKYEIDSQPVRTFSPSLGYVGWDTITRHIYVTVRNFMNCTHSDTALFIVDSIYTNPNVNPTLICKNDIIDFKSNIKSKFPITAYQWDFGDGQIVNSKGPDTTHEYIFYKHQNITRFDYSFYAIHSKGCIHRFQGTLYPKLLNLNINSTSQNICIGEDSSILIANSAYPTSKKWISPSLSIDSIVFGDTIKYKFPNPGTFDFKVYAVDNFNNNCKDTFKTTINVFQKPDLYLTPDTTNLNLCDPVSITLKYGDHKNTSIVPFLRYWEITNLNGTSNFTGLDSVTLPLAKGPNVVRFEAKTGFCSDTVYTNYYVSAPSGTLSIDRNNICKGEVIEFTISNLVDVEDFKIDFGDGVEIANTSPVKHKYTFVPIGGSTISKAIFSTNNGSCEGNPIVYQINIHEVYAKFGIDFNHDTAICHRPIHIKDSSLGADVYAWNFGDNTSSNAKEPDYHSFPYPKPSYPEADTFPISLFIENSSFGCKDTFRDTVIVLPLPNANPRGDTTCFGLKTMLVQIPEDKQDSVTYTWTPKKIFEDNEGDTAYGLLDSTMMIYVTAKDTNTRCSRKDSLPIYIIQPMKGITFDTILAPGADVILPFKLQSNYSSTWTPDSFLTCLTCPDPTAEYILYPIKYQVDFKEKLRNCFSGKSIYNIRVYPDILVNAPTAFTPNGDGVNDIYYARGFGIKKLTSFKIYNRLGQLLFHSVDEKDGWDGYYKGILQNSDTYFFTIIGESYIRNKFVSLEGNFLLLK